MKTSALFRFAAALVAATGLFTALPASAIGGTAADCMLSLTITAAPRVNNNAGAPRVNGYVDLCQLYGPPGAVLTGGAGDLDLVRTDFGSAAGGVSFMFAGTSNDSGGPFGPFGPFQADPGPGPSGVLAFDNPVTGFFALALQSADSGSFSIYLFNSSVFGGLPPRIAFDTLGIGDIDGESSGNTHLAYAGLFLPVGPSAVVPEPAGVALTLAALGALVVTRRRRG